MRPDHSAGRDRLVLAVLLTASFTVTVDFSILNVALPRIGADVGFTLADLQWIATAYSLCSAGFTLLFGRFADVFGRRRVFLAGVTLLGVSSLVGGLAGTPWLLIAARAAQGLATAAVTPAALSLLTTSFAEGRMRERALGLNGSLMAAGFTSGAVLGGVLTDVLSWRWAFFINVAVAIAVLSVAPAVLTESRASTRPRMDVPGAITVTLALTALVYGLSRAGQGAWSDPDTYGAMVVGLALLGAFLAIEKRVPQPLVPHSLLRTRSVAVGNAAGWMTFATITSVVFLLTLYFQDILGYSPLVTGLSFTAIGVGSIIGGAVGSRAIAATSARTTLIWGLIGQAVLTLPIAFLGTASWWVAVIVVTTFLSGLVNLAAIVAFMVTATSGVADGEQGVATGLATMSQQIGFTTGIPIMSAIVTASVHVSGGQTPQTLLRGIDIALFGNAALAAATAGLVAFCHRPRDGRATLSVTDKARGVVESESEEILAD